MAPLGLWAGSGVLSVSSRVKSPDGQGGVPPPNTSWPLSCRRRQSFASSGMGVFPVHWIWIRRLPSATPAWVIRLLSSILVISSGLNGFGSVRDKGAPPGTAMSFFFQAAVSPGASGSWVELSLPVSTVIRTFSSVIWSFLGLRTHKVRVLGVGGRPFREGSTTASPSIHASSWGSCRWGTAALADRRTARKRVREPLLEAPAAFRFHSTSTRIMWPTRYCAGRAPTMPRVSVEPVAGEEPGRQEMRYSATLELLEFAWITRPDGVPGASWSRASGSSDPGRNRMMRECPSAPPGVPGGERVRVPAPRVRLRFSCWSRRSR